MESLRYEHAQELRRLSSDFKSETSQLHLIIRGLREQLEEAAAHTMVQKSAAISSATSEINELKATCQALRDELDQARRMAERGTHPNADTR